YTHITADSFPSALIAFKGLPFFRHSHTHHKSLQLKIPSSQSLSESIDRNPSMAANPVAPGRSASDYSELQASRLAVSLPLPEVLRKSFKVVDGPPSSAAGNPDEIAKLFPSLFGQPSAMLVPSDASTAIPDKSLKIGVVLSGGQAPGGHNVISGLFDYLQERTKGSTLFGFRGGPAGVMKCKYVELTKDFVHPYRNQGGFDMICSGRDKIETPEQFKQGEETAKKLDLDGLVVIGGDDSNTNACLLAENFRAKNMKTKVIGCPKTIDGDLKSKEVPISFGFDTACKIYAEMIGNVMIDARSTGKYYHFVRLMGRAASHITLECSLQTHPNITIIGEEVAAKKQTLKNVTDYITDVICKRAELGYNYGVILIPEGLIDFIPEVQQLISELNEILANGSVDEDGAWKSKLGEQSRQLFDFLPKAIQEQLLLERDPHGNVQVAKIETEKMLIEMVEAELESRRKKGSYKKEFRGQSHFFGYEGRCGLPSNFDSNYCYALGYAAGALLQSGKTGLISS
ncbi:phosphofructokinase family protein, partial [Striga asiatica]